MAEPADKYDVQELMNEHSDIRREATEHTNEIIKEGLKGDYTTLGAIKDARFDINSRVGATEASVNANIDRTSDDIRGGLFTIARDTQDLRAQVISAQQAMVTGFLGVSKDTEIATLKTQVDAAKNTQNIIDTIKRDGELTREQARSYNDAALNRMLIERNSELVEERHAGRRWHDRAEQNQWAALQSQIQAFGSQLSDARNSMVNFGTQLGVGQRATSNNVS
jgi:polyhydroxyalkanoate synthesis regulator phasin